MSRRTPVRLGFVPLADAAPLVVALELGLFAREGLDVTLLRESSWASIRDRVAVGELQGAHMLGALPLATRLGLGGLRSDLIAAVALGHGGNGVTVARRIAETLPPGAVDARAVVERARALRERPIFAVVHPVSTHNYLLRHWLAAAGIDPEADVELIVVPPRLMVDALRRGAIDAFCVGEPWNSVAHRSGEGRWVTSGDAIWANHPEKVLGMDAAWCARHPDAHAGLIRALVAACAWIERDRNWWTTLELLAQPHYLGLPAVALRPRGAGDKTSSSPLATRFHAGCATFPWRSHALWYLTQMQRWHQLDEPVEPWALARACYRTDLYRTALDGTGEPVPPRDEKTEGDHATSWRFEHAGEAVDLPADTFCDGARFDPHSVPTTLSPRRRPAGTDFGEQRP